MKRIWDETIEVGSIQGFIVRSNMDYDLSQEELLQAYTEDFIFRTKESICVQVNAWFDRKSQTLRIDMTPHGAVAPWVTLLTKRVFFAESPPAKLCFERVIRYVLDEANQFVCEVRELLPHWSMSRLTDEEIWSAYVRWYKESDRPF